MTLFGESTVSVARKTKQMIMTIPAKMAADSQFDFKAGDRVHITYLPKGRGSSKTPCLVIWKLRREKKQ